MSLLRDKLLLVTFFGCLGVQSFGQTNTVSNPTNGRENDPYSKYGIGELTNSNNVVLRGMANITSAYANPYEVNSDNPASYSYLQRTTFEAGFMASTRTVTGDGLSYGTGTASISYLNIGIPINKTTGICIGFKPYTHVYYSLEDTLQQSGIGPAARSYNGNGGLNYAYLGVAKRIKGLSIGANYGYMFGTLQNNTVVFPVDSVAYTSQYNYYTRLGGMYWKGGLMYEMKPDSGYVLRFGGTLSAKQILMERLSAYQVSTYNFGDTVLNDTSAGQNGQRGRIVMPTTYSLGVILTKTDKWSIGADYTSTNWSQFASWPDTLRNAGVGKSAWKASLGGEFTPDINGIHNYWGHVTYRLGLYYGTDYINIANTTLPVYGFTAGASLPFRRSTSKLHVSLDIGRLGTTINNQLEETYVRFSLGFSFNDKWFIPRKYD
jgi:hypothetical protein